MKHLHTFRLKVTQISQTCLFELSWRKGQQVQAEIDYPQSLIQSYQTWQRAYLRYYQNSIRGSLGNQGSLSPINPHAQLVQSETKLLTEFKTWLGSKLLLEIRAAIVTEIRQLVKEDPTSQINIFLTCSSLELERLPWEAWELEKEIAASISIRLARTPINIHSSCAIPRNQYRKGGARILVIFGDQTGLDFQNDLKALRSLTSLAEIKIITWQESQPIAQFRKEICSAICDPHGWDVLFFAGHSRETAITGGEIAIAPKTTISLNELSPYLKTAQEKGLQFALFNSCSGLSIAKSLIDLGLNQVAIMREPIENTVAQVFLVKFLQVLVQRKDVCDALQETCQYLKQNKNLEYPSAYLIPSLFCHPEAKLFKIEPKTRKARWQKWLPNREGAIALSSLMLISLFPSIQESLLNKRILAQTIYRDLTTQFPQNTTPPVLLVSIDEKSLREANITELNPLNRKYLASIINKLSTLNAQVIGIDYLLDYPQNQNDPILAQSIRNAISEQGTSFVFAAKLDGEKESGILPELASLNWSLQGLIEANPYYLKIPLNCSEICPFDYLLAITQTLSLANLAQPKLESKIDYRTEILNLLNHPQTNQTLLNFLSNVRIHPITQVSEYFGQRWLQPINDFSLPPETIYQTLSASQLLEKKKTIDQQIVLIASGGYQEAGIDGEKDYIALPLATAFWYGKDPNQPNKSILTGGEVHGYMIHHWLTRHLIIPIPDFWMILVAAGLGKAILLRLETTTYHRKYLALVFLSIQFLYSLVSLQSYISLGIILPWLFPSLIFWIYLLPTLKKLNHEK